MMLLRALVIWTVQVLLFGIGIGVAGLTAHLTGPLIAGAFDIDELIPTALVFFVVAAALGWIGDGIWPQDWIYNPLL
jgi:MFS-type transporter involved in bile tolerance (Atg22 family)